MYDRNSLSPSKWSTEGITPIRCVGVYSGREYSMGEWAEGIEECALRFPYSLNRLDERDILAKRRVQCQFCTGCPERAKRGATLNDKKIFRKVWKRQEKEAEKDVV